MKSSIFNLKLSIIAIVLFLPIGVNAATFFFDPTNKTVVEGEEFSIEVKMDTGEDVINAIEGKIEFPSRNLKVKHIDISDSVINVWIEEPKVDSDEIVFSGIIPGGFDGVRRPLESGKFAGPMFKIIFEAKEGGSEAVVVKDIQALKNDNLGSEADSATVPLALEILVSGESNKRHVLPFVIIAIIIIICFRVIKFFF